MTTTYSSSHRLLAFRRTDGAELIETADGRLGLVLTEEAWDSINALLASERLPFDALNADEVESVKMLVGALLARKALVLTPFTVAGAGDSE